MDEKNDDVHILLNNLRIISCTSVGEYLGTTNDNNFYCRYSKNWWNTLTDALRMETWESTHRCLTDIYCHEIPKYITELMDTDDLFSISSEVYNINLLNSRLLKIADLRSYCKKALKGLKNLKSTYNTAYQTKEGGTYDNEFDTIIESYADIQISDLDKLIENLSSSVR